jgi:hypothetical protein
MASGNDGRGGTVSRGTNNGGGARWHLMDRAICPRCGLNHPVGTYQVRENGGECRNRRKCDERKRRRENKASQRGLEFEP